jgi:hypothetical protein
MNSNEVSYKLIKSNQFLLFKEPYSKIWYFVPNILIFDLQGTPKMSFFCLYSKKHLLKHNFKLLSVLVKGTVDPKKY